MSHPFGDLLSQHLHRKHGLSQSKLAAGILQAPTIITGMCKGRRLTGPQARERVVAIISWLHQQEVLATRAEANALLIAAGMAPLQMHQASEAILLRSLPDPSAAIEKVEDGRGTPYTSRTNGSADRRITAKSKVITHLLAQLTPFVGRVAEMSELTTLFADPAVRLLTLYGPGGIGKTRLALEVATEVATVQAARFEHGVYFVSLASVDTVYAIIPLIADVLNFSFYSEGTPVQQLYDYLRQKSLLLVLDNFEHLIGDAAPQDAPELESIALLLELLQAAPQVKILVTSRVRLNVQGEQLYLLDGIDFPQSNQLTLTAARQSSAVALFVQSARRVQVDFDLSTDNVEVVVQICRLVQGMPLAILLAAAWITVLTPAEILAKLNPHDAAHESLDFLETEWRDVPARQRSLRAVFDYSWHLLSEPEQTLFAQLSVFRNGFTRQSAESILASDTTDVRLPILESERNPTASTQTPKSKIAMMLRALFSKSLIRRQQDPAGGGRYDMHELVRQYAAERLAQSPERREAVRARHSRYYCALLSEQEARLKGTEQQAALTAIELELENIRAAWRWAIERVPIEHLAQAMESLGFFYELRNRYAEGESTFSNTVRQVQSMKHQSPAAQRVMAQALAWQGGFCRLLGRLAESSQLLQQSLAVLDNSNLAELEGQGVNAFVFLQLGRLYEAQMEFDAGEVHYQQALAIYQALSDSWGKANVLFGLGGIAYRTGDYENARICYEASLAHYRTLGDNSGSAHVLEWLSYIFRDQGQIEMAQQLTTESITLYEMLGDRAEIARGQLACGWLYIYLGRFQEAYDVVQKSAAVFAELGLTPALISPALVLATINMELGRYGEVLAQVQAHLEHSHRAGNRRELAYGSLLLAYLAVVEKRYTEAEQRAMESRALFQEINDPDRVALAITCQGYAARGLGRSAAAWQYFTAGLQSDIVHHRVTTIPFVLPGIALLLADQGKVEEAVELYALVSVMDFVANSKWRYDLVGTHLSAAASALPPEVAAAARARGKAADLWATAASLLVELGGQG